jgi:uncharacterized protein with HEPN domain
MGDSERLSHILDAIAEIESYLVGVDLNAFSSNSMMRFATVKQLEIIGEASNYLTNATKAAAPEIEWRKIVGLRHILVHEYFGIDTGLVWQIVQYDMPVFKQQIQNLLAAFADDSSA